MRNHLIGAVAITLATAGISHANDVYSDQVLNFDDINISNYEGYFLDDLPYKGLYFSGFFPSDLAPADGSIPLGIVSRPDALLGGYLQFFSTITNVEYQFDLDSAYFTASYRDGQQYTVTGFRRTPSGDENIYSEVLTLSTSGPTKIDFGWTDLNGIAFYPIAGTSTGDPYGCGRFCDYTFVMDNLDVYARVPEPDAWVLMLTGLFGLGAALRRTQRLSKGSAAQAATATSPTRRL